MEGDTFPSSSSLLKTAIWTSAVGSLLSAIVNLAGNPPSLVISGVWVETKTAEESSSVLVADMLKRAKLLYFVSEDLAAPAIVYDMSPSST